MRKKFLCKVFCKKIFPILLVGFSLGVISIWPGIIFGKNIKCFLNILRDGRDGNVELKTFFSINPNYLLKIKNTNNNYLKVLLVGDSCFREF